MCASPSSARTRPCRPIPCSVTIRSNASPRWSVASYCTPNPWNEPSASQATGIAMELASPSSVKRKRVRSALSASTCRRPDIPSPAYGMVIEPSATVGAPGSSAKSISSRRRKSQMPKLPDDVSRNVRTVIAPERPSSARSPSRSRTLPSDTSSCRPSRSKVGGDSPPHAKSPNRTDAHETRIGRMLAPRRSYGQPGLGDCVTPSTVLSRISLGLDEPSRHQPSAGPMSTNVLSVIV